MLSSIDQRNKSVLIWHKTNWVQDSLTFINDLSLAVEQRQYSMQDDQIVFIGQIKYTVALDNELVDVRVDEQVLLDKLWRQIERLYLTVDLDELPRLDVGEPGLDDPFDGRCQWPVLQMELEEFVERLAKVRFEKHHPQLVDGWLVDADVFDGLAVVAKA